MQSVLNTTPIQKKNAVNLDFLIVFYSCLTLAAALFSFFLEVPVEMPGLLDKNNEGILK